MKDCLRILIFCSAIVLLLPECKQEYFPNVEQKNVSYLVVEGFINSGQGPTTFRLSRTSNLKDTAIKPETGAQVMVEGDNGTSFVLTGNLQGQYTVAQLALNNNVKYHLHIKTADGKEYTSDFVSVKYTPPIDSITWQREDNGVRLYVNAHDPQNATRYYQWKYEETWEFHSAFYTSLKYIRDSRQNPIGVVFRNADHGADTLLFKCWNTLLSTTIILGSTEKLSADVVYLPIHFIEPGSIKLSVLYSLNLKQYALTHEAWLFMQKMKRNTEQLGTLFDPQPSDLLGNIHCITNQDEIVVGFVDVTQEQTQRIFIYNNQVPDWNYSSGCFQIEVDNNPDSIAKYSAGLQPTYVAKTTPFGDIATFYASDPPCVDCTLNGTNKKPSFWP